MTEPLPPDDEIVSAHLDGAATPDEAAAVEASAAARARREQFETVRALVGEPVTPAPGVRDAALAAALEVFDREVAGTRDPGGERVTPPSGPWIDPAVPRSARRKRVVVSVLGAAASVVLVVGVVAALRGQSSNYGNSTAAAPAASSEAADAGPGGAASADQERATGQAPLSATGPAGTVDLGVIADSAGLRAAVGAARPRSTAPAAASPTPPSAPAKDAGAAPCEAAVRATRPGLGALELVGTARFAGAPATVLVFAAPATDPAPGPAGEPASVAYLVQLSTCRIVLTEPV